MSHEAKGKTDEWYTPKYVFDALGCVFDMDVATPNNISVKLNVPCVDRIYAHEDGLKTRWNGFVWMNPPYGHQKTKILWLQKFIEHGNGIALMPDRTSAPWWHEYVIKADAVLFVKGKIKFIDEHGNLGESPSNGTNLIAIGDKGVQALVNAERNGLGKVFKPI